MERRAREGRTGEALRTARTLASPLVRLLSWGLKDIGRRTTTIKMTELDYEMPNGNYLDRIDFGETSVHWQSLPSWDEDGMVGMQMEHDVDRINGQSQWRAARLTRRNF